MEKFDLLAWHERCRNGREPMNMLDMMPDAKGGPMPAWLPGFMEQLVAIKDMPGAKVQYLTWLDGNDERVHGLSITIKTSTDDQDDNT